MTPIQAILLLVVPAQESPPDVEPFAGVRTGAWVANGFDFDAVVGSNRRQVNTHALLSLGADAGLSFSDRYLFLATYEHSMAEHVAADIVGAGLGYRHRRGPEIRPAVPEETAVYAGAIWGRFDVQEEGFGTFENSYGFRAGISLAWRLGARSAASLVGEYRLIEFEYNEDTVLGDDRVGGSTAWIGATLEVRF